MKKKLLINLPYYALTSLLIGISLLSVPALAQQDYDYQQAQQRQQEYEQQQQRERLYQERQVKELQDEHIAYCLSNPNDKSTDADSFCRDLKGR